MRMFYQIGCLCILLLLAGSNILGQDLTLKFDHISLEEGLSQAAVNAVVQDGLGFMWFATLDGLNRYDGYDMKVYRHDPQDLTSISHNKIMSLCVDGNGQLWIGTDGGGLSRYQQPSQSFSHFLNNRLLAQNANSRHIRSIFADNDSCLWVGTLAPGIGCLKPASGKFQFYPHKLTIGTDDRRGAVVEIFSSSQDGSAIFWLGTYGSGLLKFDGNSGGFTAFVNDPSDPRSIAHDIVTAILPAGNANDQRLWIATYGGGLSRFDPQTGHFHRYQLQVGNKASLSNNKVTDIYRSFRDISKIWIATEDGLNLFDVNSGRSSVYRQQASDSRSLSSNRIRSIFRDQSGSLWLGTMGGGINKFSPQKYKFDHFRQAPDSPFSLNDNFIRSIYEGRDGTVWIGTGSGGLNHFYPSKNRFENHIPPSDNAGDFSSRSVRAVYEDEYGMVWIGTEGGGLYRFNPVTAGFTRFRYHPGKNNTLSDDNIWVIHCDPKINRDLLWIGTYGGGLNKVVLTSDDTRPGLRYPVAVSHYRHDPRDSTSIPHNSVLAISHGPDSTLWIGTGKGLSRFSPASERFTTYQHDPADPQSLSNNTVTCIFQAHRGALWVGTFGGGLNAFNRQSDNFKRITAVDGLPSNVISGILQDDQQNLWISTYNGLAAFDPQQNKIRIYDTGDGIQSKEFGYGAFHHGRSGRMYFGGINGFNVFHPDSLDENNYIPPVVFTEFRVFNQPYPIQAVSLQADGGISGELTLSYQQNVFSFEFAALDYTSPANNRYAYRLEGIDKDWIYSNRRYATYAHVPPGSYIFRAKGTNSDGIWNDKGTAVRIIISPPFWETWWFRSLALGLLLILLYLLHRYRVARAIEMEQLRVQIASDLHDDLGATLTRISMHSEIIRNTADTEKIAASSGKIGEMSREIITSLSDIVWSIDSRNDSVGDLLDRMQQFAENILSQREVRLQFKVEELDSVAAVPVILRQNLYLIFKEAINNIARHSGATEVDVSIGQTADRFYLRISDNGSGLDDENLTGGNGLRNMRLRSERIGADLQLFDNQGLTIQLTMKRISG